MFSILEENSCALPFYLLMSLLAGVNGDKQPLCQSSTGDFIPCMGLQCVLFYLDRRISKRGGREEGRYRV